MTNNPTVLEINCETGEEIVRPMTEEELLQLEKDNAQAEAQRVAREAEAQAKAEAKASALAKLTALGLTEEEAAAIAGA